SIKTTIMYGLDLFSGIGGLTKALDGYVQPIAYCENERYAQAILLSRMRSRDIPIAPIWDDVRTLQRDDLPIPPDILYGGFPCQDISIAGYGKGLDGERSGLFSEIVRLVSDIRPSFVFLENSSEIASRGLGTIITAFARLRYEFRWITLSAGDVGAPHCRERWFFMAYSNSGGGNGRIADTGKTQVWKPLRSPKRSNWWKTEPDVGRVAHGLRIPARVDRLLRVGNAVVRAQVREAFERFRGLK